MTAAPMLWRGAILDSAELPALLKTLPALLADDLALRLDPMVLLTAADRLGAAILAGTVPDLQQALIETGLSSAEADQTLATIGRFLAKENLEQKLRRELGSVDPFAIRRVTFTEPVFEGWAPLGVLVHLAPANVPTVGPLSVIEGLLAGNINLLKTSRKSGRFPQVLLQALVNADQSSSLAPFIYVLPLSSQDQGALHDLFALADGIAVWGGEETVDAVKKEAPRGTEMIVWGHRISFSYLTAAAGTDPAILKGVAEEVCILEQQACSSPQCLYLETCDMAELNSFADRLGKVLATVAPTFPRTLPDRAEAAEVTTVTELVRLEGCLKRGAVVEPADRSWRLLIDPEPGLRPSPLFRTLWIKPLTRDRIVSTLRPMRAYLQTVTLGCTRDEMAPLSSLLIAAGADRIRQPGMAFSSYPGEPHDGVYALQRYSRRVSVDPGSLGDGVASLAEFVTPTAPFLPEGTPVMTKDDFHHIVVDPKTEHLSFKSGGSSGAPKLSIFSYQDYRDQMAAAADGLFAAGLDPATDRCINLFNAGHLYGGFISFFTILEDIGAIQFPMTAVPDTMEVAEAIVKYRVNTLLGIPVYLNALFEEHGDLLKEYGGVKKIFYGGEHFTATQVTHLREEFGIEIIRSAVYGSNDAGPLAFACPYCEGGVHHLMTANQWLEILKLDADEPVVGDEVGRLILTSRQRHGQQIQRYEIGDTGRWVPGPCPCGRKSPRFELMGRHGDVFRSGGPFLNYRRFVNLLTEHLAYAGEVQLLLDLKGGQEQITVRIDAGSGLDAEVVRQMLIDQYPELSLSVVEFKTTDLFIEPVAASAFERIANSGKLKTIIDRREVQA
jgi:phenylacetate-coenzyme A ligase PaaK-like adenylate-forming protein